MAAKYKGGCAKCGRPIHQGDLMDFNVDTRKVLCVCCYMGFPLDENCPHWSIEKFHTSFTGSNRYPYNPYRDFEPPYTCMVCGMKFKVLPDKNTVFLKTVTEYVHGKSSAKGYDVDYSIIEHGAGQSNDPDEKSKAALKRILRFDIFSTDIRYTALQHYDRIKNRDWEGLLCEELFQLHQH